MSGKQGTAVSDHMKYNVKPTAVRSENLLNNIKASNGNLFDGDNQHEIIFEIPAMAGGYYLDAAGSRIRFSLYLGEAAGRGTTDNEIFLDRGPCSLIETLTIHDASGHLLESISNLDSLYSMIEMCTNTPDVRQYRSVFNGEGAFETVSDVQSINQFKGGRLYREAAALTTPFCPSDFTTYHKLEFVLPSGVFGQSCQKYYPLSAMNGFRITLKLQQGIKALYNSVDGATAHTYFISDPTLFLNLIRVDPEVDRGIIDGAKGPDEKIRIHTHSWRTYSKAIATSDTSFEHVIPINVSSLKAIFFTFQETAADTIRHYGSFYTRYLSSYQLFVDGAPIPASPVDTLPPYGEAVSELCRAWHVRHGDSDFPTCLTGGKVYRETDDNRESNMVYGIELESFSGKSNTIESGLNVLNSVLQMRGTFSDTADDAYTLRFYCMFDIFIVIDPETGVTTIEF